MFIKPIKDKYPIGEKTPLCTNKMPTEKEILRSSPNSKRKDNFQIPPGC